MACSFLDVSVSEEPDALTFAGYPDYEPTRCHNQDNTFLICHRLEIVRLSNALSCWFIVYKLFVTYHSFGLHMYAHVYRLCQRCRENEHCWVNFVK
jgi:hypothetical protein